MTTPDLRYPTGQFKRPDAYSDTSRAAAIGVIAETPKKLRAAAAGLNDQQLDAPYRPDGWTVRQVVHHVADSHMNAYMRTRLALTEKAPTIKTYDEKKWAELADATSLPVDVSLTMLETLHTRWVALLRAMKPADFALTFNHPEHGERSLDWMVALYAWHGPHHTAHVTELRRRNGW